MKTIEDAIAIAAQVHKGQTDKAGAVYIMHPLRLMMKMETEAEMITAVLHDVVEDSDWTIEKLRDEGFSDEVLAAVESVTNREGESYDEFVKRASENSIGRRVKIADLEDNMNTFRLAELRPKDLDRLAKYHKSWRQLTEGYAPSVTVQQNQK
jgi:(p)ppGpp synthase/HD superfamily hydrolase